MGNLCCPQSNPCSHTADETKGLLSSSESKTSTKAEGTEGVGFSPAEVTEESRKSECEEREPDKEVVISQPSAVNKPVGVQSSYSTVINMMHTEESRAAQASLSSSPEVSAEPAVAEVEVAETKSDAGTVSSAVAWISAEDTVKALVEAEREETDPQMTDVPVKVGEAAGTPPQAQEQQAEAEASEVPTKKEAAEVDVRKDEAKVDTEKEAAEADMEKKDTDVEVEKEDAVVGLELEAAAVDVEQEPAAVDAKMEAAEVDTNVEKDMEEKPTPSADGTLNDSTADKHEVEHPAPTDVAQNSIKADTSLMVEPLISSPEPSSESNVVEKSASAEVSTEEPVEEPADEVEDRQEEDTVSSLPEVKEATSETQEHSEKALSPAVDASNEVPPDSTENGRVDDLKDETPVEVEALSEKPQETELSQKTSEEPSGTESEARLPEPSGDIDSSVKEEEEEARGAGADQEKIAGAVEQEQESLVNGLDSSAPPVEKSNSTEAHSDAAQVEDVEPTGPSDALPLDAHVQEKKEPEHRQSEKETQEKEEEVTALAGEDTENHTVQKGEIILSSSHAVEVALIPVSESITEEKRQQQQEEEEEDEDLYRAAEEIEQEPAKEKQSQPLLELTIPGVETCSLAAAVDILAYSEREWKGNTAKSTLIRKGYSEMSCSFGSLRRVRGDNYCALRATLYQVLATTAQTPAWLLEEDFTSLPEKLEAQEHLIGGWTFPSACRKVGEKEDAVEKLKHYLELLQKRWQAAAETDSLEEKQRLCERVFQGGEEEYGLLEVLKFLMLARAVELHGQMQAEQEVPVFCWLLFARDTSENPRTLLSNHLSQVGFSGGLEQVEMFLLGYALQHTIQTFRLYKTDTEEFVTHYPDDHKQDWPCVCIVTEDDRHYNVPVRKRAQHQLNHNLSALWPQLS